MINLPSVCSAWCGRANSDHFTSFVSCWKWNWIYNFIKSPFTCKLKMQKKKITKDTFWSACVCLLLLLCFCNTQKWTISRCFVELKIEKKRSEKRKKTWNTPSLPSSLITQKLFHIIVSIAHTLRKFQFWTHTSNRGCCCCCFFSSLVSSCNAYNTRNAETYVRIK